MIHLEQIDKTYVSGRNRVHVLKSVDLTIEAGEMVSVMGASGSGKSTLMNIMGLLDGYDTGAYRLDGTLMRTSPRPGPPSTAASGSGSSSSRST